MCLISAKAITKTWRCKLRLQQREKYTLEQMLNMVDPRDKQAVLKDYCSLEIIKKAEKEKTLRNNNRIELTKITKKLNIPEDMNREILSFTYWKISH
jgi:uncharacterized FlgJ-related protein